MKAIQRPLRRDWPARHLVSINIPSAAAFPSEAIDTNPILPSIRKIMNICLCLGKAVFDRQAVVEETLQAAKRIANDGQRAGAPTALAPQLPEARREAVVKDQTDSNQRYRAEIHPFKSVHTQAYFDDFDRAHRWLMKRYEEFKEVRSERAAVIYDQRESKRVFTIDNWYLLRRE